MELNILLILATISGIFIAAILVKFYLIYKRAAKKIDKGSETLLKLTKRDIK